MNIIGVKYQFQTDGKIYRVIDKINHNYILKSKDSEETKKATEQQLINKYIRLIPDAFMNIMLCKDPDDVYVCINKASNIAKGDIIPSLILRQNIPNQYNNNHTTIVMGDCITEYNNRFETKMQVCMQCSNITYYYTFSMYLDDTLDDILSIIPDNVLNKINNYLKYIEKNKKPNTIGYKTDLKLLMYDLKLVQRYREIFQIFPIGWTIDIGNYNSDGDIILTNMQKELIYNIMDSEIPINGVIKYDIDIDSNNVGDNTLWVSDPSNNIYIIIF